jgi:hypothetical protein
LTGLPATSVEEVLRRPLSVKIENTPDARPQLGINSADVVYETIVEGGITRLNCIFQSTIPYEVGPVRSGRNSDVSIVPQYDALFFMSGANEVVLGEIAQARLADMSYPVAWDLYYRVNYRYAPHDLYLYLGEAYSAAQRMGYATSQTRETLHALEFGTLDGSGYKAATWITIPFSYSYVAEWEWDATSRTYLRYMDGPTTDAKDGQQVRATNVVVLWAPYIPVLDGQTSAINLNGSGRATLFIDGRRIDGSWESDGNNPPRFKDTNGKIVKLMPGKTWFQVLDVGQEISAG